jgi:hypothetical protein
MITDKEKEVLNASIELWSKFLDLPKEHEDDNNDMRHHIHAIQNMILGRSTRRALKEYDGILNTRKLMYKVKESIETEFLETGIKPWKEAILQEVMGEGDIRDMDTMGKAISSYLNNTKNTTALYTRNNMEQDSIRMEFKGETGDNQEETGSGGIEPTSDVPADMELRFSNVGEIVIYHPGGDSELPNSMPCAPAIVTQTFAGTRINLTVFVADTSGNPVRTAWSVPYVNDSLRGEGEGYWDYQP